MAVDIVETGPDASGREWDAFLDAHQHGSFYHRYGWRRLNQVQLGHTCIYLEARDGDSVTGILPLVLTNSRIFGRILCSLPFVNFGGPLAVDTGTTQRLLKAAQEHASRLRANYLEVRCAEPLETDLPVSLHKISMTLELEADPDLLWNKFASKHRTNIRRVYKDGLTVTAGGQELLPEFYSVMQRSWRDLGTPLYAPGVLQGHCRCFSGSDSHLRLPPERRADCRCIQRVLRGTVEGMWAGTTPAGHELQANYVLYWEMIKDACERGFRRYHLGRSTAGSGAEQFKKKWNAVTTQLYWYHYRPDGRDSAGRQRR